MESDPGPPLSHKVMGALLALCLSIRSVTIILRLMCISVCNNSSEFICCCGGCKTTRDSPCFKEVEEHVRLGIQIDISRVRVDTRRRLANALLAGLLEADGQTLGGSQGRDSSRLRGQLSLDEVLDILGYHIAQDCRHEQRAASQCRRAAV